MISDPNDKNFLGSPAATPRFCSVASGRINRGGRQGPKPLPRVEPLGRARINFVKAYDKRSILKASASNDGDDPVLFIDLEHPHPEFSQMEETELHLGISANFRFEPQRDSSVQPHIDIYIPASEIPRLLHALVQANRRNGGR